MFLVNSRLGLFSAAPQRSTGKPLHATGRPFSRSYGANLPSSLTRAHPSTLVLSHPPTCVGLRYGRSTLPLTGFSRRWGSTRLALVSRSLPHASGLRPARLVVATPARRRAYDRDLDTAGGAVPAARAGKVDRNISQDAHLRVDEFIRGTSLEVRVKDPANHGAVETYQLSIPPETAPGARFRVPRAVEFGAGVVQVRVRALPGFRFKVRGFDLRSDLRISAERATRGGREMLPGATGSLVGVNIPAGVGRGETVRVPGEGLPKPRGGRGDLLVRITYRPEVRISRSSQR